MAPPENDPTQTSSGEVESSSEEEEEVSQSESEQGQTQKYTVKPSSAASSSKLTADPSKSSSSLEEEEEEEEEEKEEESESDSGSGSESKPTSYSSLKKPIAPVSPAMSKRPASVVVSEKNTVVESKRPKKKENDDAETETGAGTKKQLFQRLWTDEDEISVLQGMIDYSSERNADPHSDMPEFYNSIKNSLSIEVSNRQLREKVRRMRIKYENNAKKTKNGKEKSLSKPHEHACYVLSKKIWGKDGILTALAFGRPKVNIGTAKKAQSQTKSADVIAPRVDNGLEEAAPMENVGNVHGLAKRVLGGRASFGLWDTPEDYVNNQWKLFAGPKKIEWEKKRKKVMLEEIEAYLKCTELTYLRAKLVLEAMKSPEEGTGGSSS